MLWRFLFAHFVADFMMQNDDMVRGKSQFKHLMIHAGICMLMTLLVSIDILSWNLVLGVVFIVLSHIAVDYWKATITPRYKSISWIFFLADQVLHITFIVLAVYWITQGSDYAQISVWNGFGKILTFRWLSLVIVNLLGGMYFTQQVLASFVPDSQSSDAKAYTSPSAFIGIMERILIMIAILINRFEIIGYLFAAKSIIRYPEVTKESSFSNYYLIGTLSSFCWAIVWSIILK